MFKQSNIHYAESQATQHKGDIMADAPQAISKTTLGELTEDYTLEPVPAHINTTGLRVAMVICAIGITLPAIWVSSDRYRNQ